MEVSNGAVVLPKISLLSKSSHRLGIVTLMWSFFSRPEILKIAVVLENLGHGVLHDLHLTNLLPWFFVTHFHTAVVCKSESRARGLILGGAININQPDSEGSTPLIYAAGVDLPLIVETLLELGADLDAVINNSGSNALHLCTTFGGVSSATKLVEAGANIEAKSEICDATPLHMAAQTGILE